jgi:hypothetical protein
VRTPLRGGPTSFLPPDTPAGARMADYAAFFDFMLGEFPAVMARWDARAEHGR